MILLPPNYTVAPRVLWSAFLKAVFRTIIPVFVAVFNNFLPCLLDKFLANYKNSYPLKYIVVLGSIE